MYSIHNVGKLVVAEIVIKTLKTKIYKYRISISRNVYIDKLHDIIKIKPVDVKDNTYIDFDKKKVTTKILNFKLVILLEYQNTFF